jgi:hypothetical protein
MRWPDEPNGLVDKVRAGRRDSARTGVVCSASLCPDRLHCLEGQMIKIRCWALQDKRGRFVQRPDLLHYQFVVPFKTMTFRTRKDAQTFLDTDAYWFAKAKPVRVIIRVEESI